MGRCVAYGKGSMPARMLRRNALAECAPVYTQQGGWTNSNIERQRKFRR